MNRVLEFFVYVGFVFVISVGLVVVQKLQSHVVSVTEAARYNLNQTRVMSVADLPAIFAVFLVMGGCMLIVWWPERGNRKDVE